MSISNSNSFMRIGGLLPNSTTNGEGIRSVIFFSGCPHKCKGCHNEHIQNFDNPHTTNVTLEQLTNFIKSQIPYIDGVTLSGGEPFSQSIELLSILTKQIKDLDLNIWCYTGYKTEELLSLYSTDTYKYNHLLNTLDNIDILVDGKFEEDNLDTTSAFRGSTNQRFLTSVDIRRYINEGVGKRNGE